MKMLYLSDGSSVVISSLRDFSDLIDEKLGMDARMYFDNVVDDYMCAQECIGNLYDEVQDMRRELRDATL